ncbi:hypothetical protein CDD80_2633 [Ophiocordyceps camponoti-rufipedis]|uniref:Uncharacterized protein n=1 Tax=Ophiocordyceps camponoti-rufipedis TaxID=2004952 RepID=A0A2C5Z5U9_9HYPO|nr:hypothetical protein CDD80_2633 [Ophiocordyceps camponoti-rufipedis]
MKSYGSTAGTGEATAGTGEATAGWMRLDSCLAAVVESWESRLAVVLSDGESTAEPRTIYRLSSDDVYCPFLASGNSVGILVEDPAR